MSRKAVDQSAAHVAENVSFPSWLATSKDQALKGPSRKHRIPCRFAVGMGRGVVRRRFQLDGLPKFARFVLEDVDGARRIDFLITLERGVSEAK